MDDRLQTAQAALENELKSTTLAQVVADTRKIIDGE
jgi:DNA-binding IscR family transcriptional regulator